MRLSPSARLDAGARAGRPSRRRPRPSPIAACTAPGVVENSRAAFDAAIAAGHGIELDVQAEPDGEAMVFHDYELDRLTGRAGRGRRARRAASWRRSGSTAADETIPRLAEILALIAGRVPLLIEVKSPEPRRRPACAWPSPARSKAIAAPVGVMSFNPEVGALVRAPRARACCAGWS